MLSDIILFILGEHNDTVFGKAELNWHRVRSDLELESSMRGHLLKNICEPYVICNKKRRSRWRVPNYLKMNETPFGCDMTVTHREKLNGFEETLETYRKSLPYYYRLLLCSIVHNTCVISALSCNLKHRSGKIFRYCFYCT